MRIIYFFMLMGICSSALSSRSIGVLGTIDYTLPDSATTEFGNLCLSDSVGQCFRLADLQGKVVFLDFWFTGCAGCKMFYEDILKEVKTRYHNEVVFVSISVDKDVEKWKTSLRSGEYTDSLALNLVTNGMGSKHPIIQALEIKSYPALFILDKQGKILNRNKNRELRKKGDHVLEKLLQEALEE